MMKIIELTKENEKQYLDQIAELEQIVLKAMEEEGREGQLFATGKEDISEYIHSQENTVIIAANKDNEIESATYITQGQKPFTYNDITKYFKYGENYKQYVKSTYKDDRVYKEDLLDIYKLKIKAFEYAKNKILSQNSEMSSINEFLEKEIQENGFHEKSVLREEINKYMSEYIQKFEEDIQKKYESFYWITAQDISEEFERKIDKTGENIQEYEQFMQEQSEYEEILKHGTLRIHEKPSFEEQKYYSANTRNSVELDTYITSPQSRSTGIARIIVYEGIKKHIEQHFKNPKNTEIYLCSTLHRDNLSSKYVSEFFGLTDSLYVNRRQGRDREVHMCKIPRENAIEYLAMMSDKLAVLYNYNPNQKHISKETRKNILQEQLDYEKREQKRLIKAKATDQKFNGTNLRFIESKGRKIKKMQEKLNQLDEYIGGNAHGE